MYGWSAAYWRGLERGAPCQFLTRAATKGHHTIHSSFAELGSAIPLSGGAQAYLAYAYHPIVSYLYAWTAISTLKPGGGAIVALIFGCVV